MRILKALFPVLLIVTLQSTLSYAAAPDRITGNIDSTNLIQLRNHITPMARTQFDKGPVEPSHEMHMTLMFLPSAQQEQQLQTLLADQQNSKSPRFHQWLTPQQYGEQFGLSQGDLEKITAWLQGEGFQIMYTARGKDFVSFEGNAAQVDSVFRTGLHYFEEGGKMHFANTKPPMIPAALSGIVVNIRGLHNFFPRPMHKRLPQYSISGFTTHFLAPGDIATIYDINTLYNASPAINGTGQKVAIVGQSDVYLADLNYFRNGFGFSPISGCTMNGTSGVIAAGSCSSGNFGMVVPGTGSDPGVSAGNLGESDLDIEWMGSVARGAEIIFVTSSNGVDDSASWIIDNQLAPVISYSYGLCEAYVTAGTIAADEQIYAQAQSEGIAFFAAAGDSAAAECDGDDQQESNPSSATLGASVSYPASSAYVTGVGGTEFNEGTNSSTYWGSTNGTNGGSATEYIPELAWNDSTFTISQGLGFDGTGGGASNCANGNTTTTVGGFTFQICSAPPAGGIAKPSWQSGITPSDSVRDVPDISFSASNVNDPYIVCVPESELIGNGVSTSTCANGINSALTAFQYPSAFGGTSASTPLAAGMTVLLNQEMGGSVGSINEKMYTVVYQSNPSAFHDIVAGTSSYDGDTSNNVVPCTNGDPTFEPAALRCSGGSLGFKAGTGYDQVTGLGSLDIGAFVKAWSATTESFTLTSSVGSGTVTVAAGSSTSPITLTISSTNGFVVTSGSNSSTAQPLTYTCVATTLPGESTCTFSPNQQTSQTTVSLTIQTTAPTASLQPDRRGVVYAMTLPGLFGLFLTVGTRKRSLRGMRMLGMIAVVGFLTLGLGSCSGSNNGTTSNNGTPPGSYTVTVNATTGGSSPIQNSTTVKLTVTSSPTP
jgi:subtilase family serine protease